ncbi:ABC transporter ATP-binding protein [Cognatilysobacter lacus]|uniref:ABC transporter ATP-binding protein n=1 Tax=Cognatilysobacter lacus TaxID=1643323 RepID=A0A5D8Z8R6_9GAMM|nr:ABC transporter ATP-binding protein [Lysobacter lacus]TZF91219.1 ABC transporter ATP-binding protein [Lysobacter lacus]
MPSISIANCDLQLPIYGTINRSFKGAVLSSATGGRIASASRNVTVVQALKDISLEIRSGDRVGLMGHNGSGKTSLLRLMSGIYEPTAGRVHVEGKVSSFINLGLGLDHEATGYENILLCGLMFGLRHGEIRSLTPSIAEFSGLADFLDMPVRTYSSGMLMRLVFSIVTSVHAEILLMDEWLSVGDADFVAHAESRLNSLVDAAGILVLASHSEETIRAHCNMIVRLEHGEIVSVERLPALDTAVPESPQQTA